MKKYLKIKNPDRRANYLKVEVYYDLGGFSYATYTEKPRGYYISVTPVTREDRGGYTMESFTAFTGYKHLLLEVKRSCQKQYEKAVELSQDIENQIIDRLSAESGFEV